MNAFNIINKQNNFIVNSGDRIILQEIRYLLSLKHAKYVTVFWKSSHLCTRAEIHLLLVHDRHIMHHSVLDYRSPGLLLQMAFYRCCETTRVHFMVLRRINRIAWGTKLLLTPVIASFVDCISLFCTLEGTALLFESEWLL